MNGKNWKLFDFEDIHTHVAKPGAVLSIDVANAADLKKITGYDGSFTAGIHPWNADKPVDWDKLTGLLHQQGAVGVGEAGLDYLRGPAKEIQMDIFRKQIELAEKFQMPLVIHAVKAYHDILALRKEYNPTVPWVIHGFRGNAQLAKQLSAAGIHLSLGDKYNNMVTEIVPPLMLHRESDDEPESNKNP